MKHSEEVGRCDRMASTRLPRLVQSPEPFVKDPCDACRPRP
jgi:hypothetical protein